MTDDRAARSFCQEQDVEFTGTIGILKALCLDSTLRPGDADDLLRAMVDAGFYAPVQRISDIL